MIIKEQQPITLLNPAGAKFSHDDLVAAILWFAAEPVARIKKVFMWGHYPAVAIRKHKLHIHRLLYAYWNKGIPRGMYVNHIDGNKLNARKHNLELLTASEHQRITNLGRKQTPEHVAKRIRATTKTRYENPYLLKNNN